MKKNIKKIIDFCILFFCRLFAVVFSYSLFNKFYFIKSKFFSYWLSSELKLLGKNSFFYYPISLRGGKFISIGDNTSIGARGIITAWDSYNGEFFSPKIIIGNNIWIGEDCHITAINSIQIGNNALIGKKVTITDNSHGKSEPGLLEIAPNSRPLYSKGPVILENNVWVGDKVTILPGVKIGKNSIIGANSVVTKNVDENCIVGGNPAKILKRLKDTL
jgi:acetyltransferase-like isoleucine patch superfamily enzyme